MDLELFRAPITEIIKRRISVRTYLEQPLTSKIKETLLKCFTVSKGPFGTPVRYNLIERDLARSGSKAKLGTYGVIRGASTYVVAVVEKADKDLEDFGYSLENAILFATSLGLGTCWLGGTFKKSEFSKAIDQKEYEILPCISPIGYPSSKRSLIDTAMRFTAGSKSRKEWRELFFSGEFGRPLSIEEAGKYKTPLEMVRIAPSASNKQPWRVVKANNILHFYLQHTKGYAKLLAYDLQRVDMGIAMCHFELTAKESGINGCWSVGDPGSLSKPQDTDYVVSWIESV